MNDLCADIGYKSIIHVGEELCGDHIDIVEHGDNSTVIVLADGLGSGVKASILSTITSKIISTMIAEGMTLEDCVETIAETLPVCSERGLAYSTFTILHIIDNRMAELIQYDNPHVIMIRDNKVFDYPKTEILIEDKRIYRSSIWLKKDDIFVMISDGCPYAGKASRITSTGKNQTLPSSWQISPTPGIRPRCSLPCWLMNVTGSMTENRLMTPQRVLSVSAPVNR